MNTLNRCKMLLFRKLGGLPVKARHTEVSLLSSADDALSNANDVLIDISLNAIKKAKSVRMDDICSRMSNPPYYPNIWPGEHYKILVGLMETLNPKTVVEIGTAEGLSALAIKKGLSKDSTFVTFDIIPWQKYPNICLKESDFSDKFIQHTDDLTDYSAVLKHEKLLKSTDIIFVDAAKDGKMEYLFMQNFKKLGLKEGAIIIFDDIRVWNMLGFWRSITQPKLDLTSFGHWSGTGIIEWHN